MRASFGGLIGTVNAVRLRFFVAAVAVIACGLALRRWGYDAGLPFVVVKYGGSILWGGMVYLLMAMLIRGLATWTLAGLAVALAVAVELSRLHHTPWMDAFRLTTAGALLLGRVFSLLNIVAYVAGIGSAAILTRSWRLGRG